MRQSLPEVSTVDVERKGMHMELSFIGANQNRVGEKAGIQEPKGESAFEGEKVQKEDQEGE